MPRRKLSKWCKLLFILSTGSIVLFQVLSSLSDIKENILRGVHPDVPSYLQDFVIYEASAKQALINLIAWSEDHGLTLPLFPNRLMDTSLTPPRICVAISTAVRANTPFTYLIQAVSALLNRMNYSQYKDLVYIHVFNTADRIEAHQQLPVVRQLVPVTTINKKRFAHPIPRKYQEELDAAQIYRLVHRMKCDYSLFIEDDALAKNEWIDSVLSAISYIEQMDSTTDPWLIIKLFCTHKNQPFDCPPPENLSRDRYQDFNLVAAIINRVYLIQLADYFDAVITQAVDEKDFDRFIAKDLELEKFRRENGLAGFCLEPVVFQHTGIFSSIVERGPDRWSVNQWYMKAPCFPSEAEPILFNSSLWLM